MLLTAALLALALPRASAAGLDLARTPGEDPARNAVLAVTALPRQAQIELKRAYEAYGAAVQRRLDEGWRAGLLSGSLVENPEEPSRPVRQLEESLAKRLAESKPKEARDLRRQLSRSKGLALDWSDAVWAELTALQLKSWSVSDIPRKAGPRHTAALLCTPPGESELCLAFDPWPNGRAQAYEFESWDSGSFAGRIPPQFFLHSLPGS